jgi:hypothetical protein
MAQPDLVRGTYFSLMLGDGAGPETFAALCGVKTKTFTHKRNTNDQYTRDCANPEDVPIRRLIVTGEAWTLTGAGVLDRNSLPTLQAADDNQPHNWRFLFTEPSDDLVFQGYYGGPGIMTSLEITGDDENFANISFTIESDGQWPWTTV